MPYALVRATNIVRDPRMWSLQDARSLPEAARVWMDAWAVAFAERGFLVRWECDPAQPIAYVKGKSIRGAFSFPGYPSYHLAGALLADNVRAFNKWGQCPCRVRLGRRPEKYNWDRLLVGLAQLAARPRLAAQAFGPNDTPFLWDD